MGLFEGFRRRKEGSESATVPGVGLLHEFGVMKWHT